MVEPTPTKKQSEMSQPIEKQPPRFGNSEPQIEEPLDDDSHPDPPKPKKQSRELALRHHLEMHGSHRLKVVAETMLASSPSPHNWLSKMRISRI
jgi:hypothetical protein